MARTQLARRGAERITEAELARVSLLADLLPDQLAALASACQPGNLKQGDSCELPRGGFCFVLSGALHLLPPEEGWPERHMRTPVVTLHAGDHIGALWADEGLPGIVEAITDARLAILERDVMRRFVADWPEFLERVSAALENRAMTWLRELMLAQALNADTDRVLRRIETVTRGLLRAQLVGGEGKELVQRKFLAEHLPEKRYLVGCTIIEQGYLPPEDDEISEDRIRRVEPCAEGGSEGSGQVRHVRTRRYELGNGRRRELAETLGEAEYYAFRRRIIGKMVLKKRWRLRVASASSGVGADIKATADVFEAPARALELLKGRVLLEVSAPDEASLKDFDPARAFPGIGEYTEVTGDKRYQNRVLSEA